MAERGVAVELVPITTRGDAEQADPIGNLGSPGVFTKEIQRALVEERIDVAVHSLKDLPTDMIEGLCLAAVPQRETVYDALISREGLDLESLPRGALIGTGSLRRRAQLMHARDDLQMRGIRGNVDTRLEKLAAGQFDAIVLAVAGLKRLGIESRITQLLEPPLVLPAVGQGALGIEARALDRVTREALAPLDHEPSHQAVIAERSLLAALAGGCLAPIGGWARPDADGKLLLSAVVLSSDGRRRLTHEDRSDPAAADSLGRLVAEQLIAQGADKLIADVRLGG